MSSKPTLKAPYPYFGGKSRIADLVWERFGDVPNYVEPFFGSGAVCLARPHAPRTETVNDLHGFIPNFWRAIAAAPDAVAHYADWPVMEADLYARHVWLVTQAETLNERLRADPDYCDAKIAGWWVWGASCWIGSGWCDASELRADSTPREKLPLIHNDGVGVHKKYKGIKDQVPDLTAAAGRGVHSSRPNAALGPHRASLDKGGIEKWFAVLSARLRRVRVCCGDWARVTGECVTFRHGLTGVFLDPPYDPKSRAKVYAQEADITADVLDYCQANGQNPLMRIAVCGYADGCGYEVLESEGWAVTAWKSAGGYGAQGEGRGRDNANRERIWFSPNCLKPLQGGLFQ